PSAACVSRKGQPWPPLFCQSVASGLLHDRADNRRKDRATARTADQVTEETAQRATSRCVGTAPKQRAKDLAASHAADGAAQQLRQLAHRSLLHRSADGLTSDDTGNDLHNDR